MEHKDRSKENSRGSAKRQPRPPRRIPAQTRKDGEALRQLHDLQVQRLELEMQNDELKKVRTQLQASLDRYTALYEFAPVGLLTLETNGSITECNPAGTRLLRMDLSKLLEKSLASFVVSRSYQAFHDCLYAVFHGEQSRQCELELLRPDGSRLVAQLTVVRQPSGSTCVAALTDITEQHDLLEQNRTLARRMFELLESDRRSLAHEIQEELRPWLTSTYAATASILQVENTLKPETRHHIRAVVANTAEMQNVLRHMLLKLRPTMLDTVSLSETLRELINLWRERHTALSCIFEHRGDVDHLDESLNIAVFRITQEALANVAKHAHAEAVGVCLERVGDTKRGVDSNELVLTIHDDGDGFDPAQRTMGLGLLSMRERAIALGGQFELATQPGHGTTIHARLPTAGHLTP